MNSPSQRIAWPLALGLGIFALIRPLLSITGLAETWGKPATPLIATAVISVVWILAAAFFAREPVMTLIAAGVVYALLAMVLSAVLSMVLESELQGPLAQPFGFIAILVTNVLWGVVTGLIAQLLAHSRRG